MIGSGRFHQFFQFGCFRREKVDQVVILRRIGSKIIQFEPSFLADIEVEQFPVTLDDCLAASLFLKFKVKITVFLLTLFPRYCRENADAICTCGCFLFQ